MDLYHCSICKCPLAADVLCTAWGSIQHFCRDPGEGGENKGHQPLLTALRGTRNNPKEPRAQSWGGWKPCQPFPAWARGRASWHICFVQVLTLLAAGTKHFRVALSQKFTLMVNISEARHSGIWGLSFSAVVLKQALCSRCGAPGTQTGQVSL